MQKNKIVKTRTTKEIKQDVLKSSSGFDAWYILQKADKEMENFKGPKEIASNTNYYKAMTLFEFDKGILMLNAIPELHRVFALEFYKNLQTEYNCASPSDKSLAEAVTLNFIRILEVQRRIKNSMENIKTRYDIQYISVLSKELDRAERHYLNSLQTLKMLKSPSFELNIKANTAVIGQNQMVQANNQPNNYE